MYPRLLRMLLKALRGQEERHMSHKGSFLPREVSTEALFSTPLPLAYRAPT